MKYAGLQEVLILDVLDQKDAVRQDRCLADEFIAVVLGIDLGERPGKQTVIDDLAGDVAELDSVADTLGWVPVRSRAPLMQRINSSSR